MNFTNVTFDEIEIGKTLTGVGEQCDTARRHLYH
jgi:hypothetical protein